jgi:hypothetical protein
MVEKESRSYDFDGGRAAFAIFSGTLLESAQEIQALRMPEPFDLTNHGGNMWVGAGIAAAVSLGHAVKNDPHGDVLYECPGSVNSEAMGRFRRFSVAAICGATALVNCVTETKWGVQYLPVAEALNGPEPDILDTIYSVAAAGIASFAVWRRS